MRLCSSCPVRAGVYAVTCSAKSPAKGDAGIVMLGRKDMGGLGIVKKPSASHCMITHVQWQVACPDTEVNPQP